MFLFVYYSLLFSDYNYSKLIDVSCYNKNKYNGCSAYVGKAVLSNEYNPANTLTFYKNDFSYYEWYVNIINNWRCFDYFKDKGACVISATKEITAPENKKNAIINYTLIPTLLRDITECSCQNWNVTIVGSDGITYLSETLECGGEEPINPANLNMTYSLPPNNDKNTYYNINAKLYSYRKVYFSALLDNLLFCFV